MKNLTEILKNKKISCLKIDEILLLKLGCILYSTKKEFEDEQSIEPLNKEDELIEVEIDEDGILNPNSLLKCLTKTLERHPNVFGLLVNKSKNVSTTMTNNYTFLTGVY
jgi:hypothetical protein